MSVAIAERPEHAFAGYIRALGKGPSLSRTLTQEESYDAARMIFAGDVDRLQLGAFLCLIRMMTETPEEVAGIVRAARETMAVPASHPPVALDWPAYAGKRRRLPWFLLSALLLAENDLPVLMHGLDEHTPGRIFARAALAALGVRPARSLDDAAAMIAARGFAYIPVEQMCPSLYQLMELKPLLGLRSPVHTMVRKLNPFGAPGQIIGVAHPAYRPLHQQAARLLGQQALAVFRGDGGEAEVMPGNACEVFGLRDGEPFEEIWPASLADSSRPADGGDPGQLRRVWLGEAADQSGEAAVVATCAIALKMLGKADSQAEATARATQMWVSRSRRLENEAA